MPPPPFTPEEQRKRLGRLESLAEALAESALQSDPDGLAPERIVVFETNAPVSRILKAAKRLGFHHFQELVVEDSEDEEDFEADGREAVAALYVGLPTEKSVRSLVYLYRNWKANRSAPRNYGAFNELFERLIDVRLWGPRDRLNEEDLALLRDLAKQASPQPVLLEVELWPTRRPRDAAPIIAAAQSIGALLLDQAKISEDGFAYQALLFELPANQAAAIIDQLRDGPLGKSEDVYSIGAASHAQAPVITPARPTEAPASPAPLNSEAQIQAVLIDGAAIANHPLLRGGVVMEDMFEHEALTAVGDRRHATAMASIILRGDMRTQGTPVRARLLNIPLLVDATDACQSNPRKLLLDQVHRALKRALIGDAEGPPSAPEAFIVNLSIGIANRVFANRISGLARLIDWWAAEHGILFIVAAGNTTEPLLVRNVNATAFEELDVSTRARATTLALIDAAPRRALLAPAECINGLTVGASAASSAPANSRGANVFHPFDGPGEPSIISRSGFGARGALKPDILAPGGRPRARFGPSGEDTRLSVQDVFTMDDALLAAAPLSGALSSAVGPTCGTSPAAAATTRTALQVIAGLEAEGGAFPNGLRRFDRALMAKALIAQSATWGKSGADVCAAIKARDPDVKWQRQRTDAARLIGFGAADPVRAVASDDHRVTCVGLGKVEPEEAVVYNVPLPADLSASIAPRRIVITLAWFSPVSPWRSKLALARLQADVIGAETFAAGAAELLGTDEPTLGPPPHFGRRGSVWTGCYGGMRAVAIGPDANIDIRVSCFADSLVDDPLRFAIAVTFETEADVPIYASVAQRLRPRERTQV